MPPLLTMAVWVLAVARISRLITTDRVTEPVRDRIGRIEMTRWWQRSLAYLLGGVDQWSEGCQWCMSVWVAALTVAPMWWWHTTTAYSLVALALAASQVTGMIHKIGRE